MVIDNYTIAKSFLFLAQLMELHDENPYKIRSYSNAFNILRRWDDPLVDLELAQLKEIPGVGDAIANKIVELRETGVIQTLEKIKEKTPLGIQELVRVRGLGPKKIKQLWKELGVDSIGSLYYAANENRIVSLKGFAEKTQLDIVNKLDVHLANANKMLLGKVMDPAIELEDLLKTVFDTTRVSITGEVRRAEPMITSLQLIAGLTKDNWGETLTKRVRGIRWENEEMSDMMVGKYLRQYPFELQRIEPGDYVATLFRSTGPEIFVQEFDLEHPVETEEEIFTINQRKITPPECRGTIKESRLDRLIEQSDIRGIIHCHSVYSDGIQTIKEMALHAEAEGFEYLAITDHSRMAFYANGMTEEEVKQQWLEIDELNADEAISIPILKGIECDILTDDQLDYTPELLSGFDVVIASVHSHLKMDEKRATQRIISAIEHPLVNVIGHPTGRIFMAREGYPLNVERIIDACAANKVALELNANPYRLDVNWTWLERAMEKNVMISINPDAHNLNSIQDVRWGVYMARKGGLSKELCLTALEVDQFLSFCQK